MSSNYEAFDEEIDDYEEVDEDEVVKAQAITLFDSHPELFELIDPKEFEECPEDLYCDGEADIIRIEGKAYRYRIEEIADFDQP